MRRILYSPGFGAGWVSWHHGSRESSLFMLEYKPFADALIAAGNSKSTSTDWDAPHSAIAHLVEQFRKDFAERFPGVDLPYEGGLRSLCVMEVPDGSVVRISEYDGSESVSVKGSEWDEWL